MAAGSRSGTAASIPRCRRTSWRLARRIADAGVAVTVLPATDLFMMGRDQDHSVRRGVVDVNVLMEHGVNCSISSNNVLNPFTPLGDCSLLRMANLQANVCQIGQANRLRECFDMLTERSARLMNLPDYGIAVGNPGDIVVVDARRRNRRWRRSARLSRCSSRPAHGHPAARGTASAGRLAS